MNEDDLITANYLAKYWLGHNHAPVFAKLVEEVKRFQQKVERKIEALKEIGMEV